MNETFWQGKTVFVTGHTGFKGAWLSFWLNKMGAEVTGFSNCVPTNPSGFEAMNLGSQITDIRGDVRDLDALTQALNQAAPEIVLHLAAQPLVIPGFEDPVGTYSTNVMGTVNLLEAVRQNGEVKACVVITSDKVYKNKEKKQGYSEGDELGGDDPYAGSKACAELVVETCRSAFLNGITPVASARAGNVIGGGDWAPYRLMPDVICALNANQPVDIRRPKAVRPWQHVLEPLSGYLLLAEKLYNEGQEFAGGYNFGPQKADCQPVGDVVAAIGQAWGGKPQINMATSTYHETGLLLLKTEKAKKKLGWVPTWDLKTAIENTVAWYKAFYDGEDIAKITSTQIDMFLGKGN